MSIHSPTILEAYFIYSPPSFNLNHFLPGITLTLDPVPVLNPSEKNFCIFPATVLQLPAPGTLFFAFPPAKAGKPSLPRPLHVCTTSHPLLLLRAVNQAILSSPASSIFPSLPDHLTGIKTLLTQTSFLNPIQLQLQWSAAFYKKPSKKVICTNVSNSFSPILESFQLGSGSTTWPDQLLSLPGTSL